MGGWQRGARGIIHGVYAAMAVYVLLSLFILPPPSPTHLTVLLTGVFLTLEHLRDAVGDVDGERLGPIRRSASAVLGIAAAAGSVYFYLSIPRLTFLSAYPSTLDLAFGGAVVVAALHIGWRRFGWVMSALVLALLVYARYGAAFPGLLEHPGFSWHRILIQLTTSFQGIYGDIPRTIATMVTVFIVFGGVVQHLGLGEFFAYVASAASRRLRSGPAQTSIIMSGLFGSISGSPVANAGTTGAFTIPLMRRNGYSGELASAVEASASIGSQFIPPVMGTGAFIMADFLGRPYAEIAAANIFPSVIYLSCLALTVHVVASRLGLRADAGASVSRRAAHKFYHLLPVGVLIVRLAEGRAADTAVYQATLVAIAVFLGERLVVLASRRAPAREEVAYAAKTLGTALVASGRSLSMVILAGALIGMIVQLVYMPFTLQRFSTIILEVAGGNLLVLLLLVVVLSILLGTGVPTVACYVLLALLLAPGMVQLGVDPLAAHLFVFYYGVLADLSPPTAMAVLTASSIAQSSFWRSTLNAMRLALPAFVLPFLFVYQPEILKAPRTAVAWMAYASVFLGFLCLVPVFEGYLFRRLRRAERVGFALAAVLLLAPSRSIAIPLAGLAVAIVAAVLARPGSIGAVTAR